MRLTHSLLFLIGWKTNERRFIPQTKNPTNVGLDVLKRIELLTLLRYCLESRFQYYIFFSFNII